MWRRQVRPAPATRRIMRAYAPSLKSCECWGEIHDSSRKGSVENEGWPPDERRKRCVRMVCVHAGGTPPKSRISAVGRVGVLTKIAGVGVQPPSTLRARKTRYSMGVSEGTVLARAHWSVLMGER